MCMQYPVKEVTFGFSIHPSNISVLPDVQGSTLMKGPVYALRVDGRFFKARF